MLKTSAAKLKIKSSAKPRNAGRQTVPAPATPGTIVRIPKAAEVVAAHIRKMILRGQLAEGDNLAPEGQLLKTFGISRPTLREAFRILETERFISVSRGSRNGAQVHKPRAKTVALHAAFALQADGTTLADVYEARIAMEVYAVRALAERRDAKAVKKFRDAVAATYKTFETQQLPNFHVELARLHRTLVMLSGNRTLTLFVDLIEEIVERHQLRFSATSPTPPSDEHRKVTRAGLRSFDKVIGLIEAGETAKAEAHWRKHLENANAVWLRGFDQAAIIDILD